MFTLTKTDFLDLRFFLPPPVVTLENSPEDVLDEAITTGRNNWMMYGSRKPGNEPNKLTYYYKITINNDKEGAFSEIEELLIDSSALRTSCNALCKLKNLLYDSKIRSRNFIE